MRQHEKQRTARREPAALSRKQRRKLHSASGQAPAQEPTPGALAQSLTVAQCNANRAVARLFRGGVSAALVESVETARNALETAAWAIEYSLGEAAK